MHPLEQLRDDALREIEAARDEKSLEGVRVKYLGKKRKHLRMGEQDENAQQRRTPSRRQAAQPGAQRRYRSA